MMGRLLTILLLMGCLTAHALAMRHTRESISRKSRMPPRPPAPPVPRNFTECEMQKKEFPHIRCEPDGNFSAIQCSGRRHGRDTICFCVDPLTGDKLNDERFPERESRRVDCTQVTQCSESLCTTLCTHGYHLDENGCATCRCKVSPRAESCQTVTELVLGGCPCGCIEVPDGLDGSNCPFCTQACNVTTEESSIQAEQSEDQLCPVISQCETNETVLLSIGANGVNRCVQPLPPNSSCEEDHREPPRPGRHGHPKPAGVDDRHIVGDLRDASLLCQEGYVCKQVGLREKQCQPEDSAAPCIQIRDDPVNPEYDPTIECDENGNFKPLQCQRAVTPPSKSRSGTHRHHSPRPHSHRPHSPRPHSHRPHSPRAHSRRGNLLGSEMCHCVQPSNGSEISGTETEIRPGYERPDCDRKVYRHCDVPGIRNYHRRFHVHHDEYYFDAANCRTCQCKDGNATAFCSEPGNCSVVVPQPMQENCTLPDGDLLPHGMLLNVGCDTCGCWDGRLRCTHPHYCHVDEDKDDICGKCREGPPDHVCGPGGVNHLSKCAAIHCAGIPPVELNNGPCQNQDVCQQYPCREGEVCYRNGGVACIGRRGCKPDQLRTCIDLDNLKCPVNETDTAPGLRTVVCGSDNQTYLSLCQLIQRTSNVQVVHAGPCEDPNCQLGPVCGADGVTYPNICVLRSQSSTRLDYYGDCDNEGVSVEEHCERIRDTGRCIHNSTNCRNLVQPEDGCCPICGGTVIIAVDRDALEDATMNDPELSTVDGFVERMTETAVFQTVGQSCTIEATITDTGNLEITLVAKGDNNSEFCNEKANEIAALVNNGMDIPAILDGTSDEETNLPQVYEFALAASASPLLVQEEGNEEEEEENGDSGVPTMVAAYSLTMLAPFAGLFVCIGP